MRELKTDTYNFERYTDENLLYKNELIDTVSLSKKLTWLYGSDSEMFSLLTLTEGQDGIKSIPKKELNDTQYIWKTIGRMKHVSAVLGLSNTNVTKPGLGFQTFEVKFEDELLLKYHTVTTPDKSHICRIQGEPVKLGYSTFKYTMIILTGDEDEYVSLDNFQAGQNWVMGAAKVAASKSDGVTSNSMSPGKWTNQFSFVRFGKQIAGNVSNKVINVEFDTIDNAGVKGTTNKWMPWEMKQFEIDRKIMLEDALWNDKYNRDSFGRIMNKDDETGEPIPSGAGVKEILKITGQHDTYGTLTIDKLDSVVNSLFGNRIDKTPMEIVLYTGAGGMRMMNSAIKTAAQGNSYYDKLGSEEIMSGTDGYLSYGKYFNQYKTIDGHILTVKRSGIFDDGLYAELDRANGNMYKGFPAESYNICILDHSVNSENGERNIQLVGEQGREMITGVYKGMSPLPPEWGGIERKGGLLSTRKDIASYEVLMSQGIAMLNYTTSYFLEFKQ